MNGSNVSVLAEFAYGPCLAMWPPVPFLLSATIEYDSRTTQHN